jgi:hypothetical protein
LTIAAATRACGGLRSGLPWFAWYDDRPALEGSAGLAGLGSVRALGARRGEAPLPENEGFEPLEPVALRPGRAVGFLTAAAARPP